MKREPQTEQMRDRLKGLHALDQEERIGQRLLRLLEDPLKPRATNGHFRPCRILLVLAVIGALSAATFLFFSFGGA